MQKYVITTDTTADLPKEYIEKYSINIIPLYYSLDDTIYGDEKTLDPLVFFSRMRKGEMPTTMASNPEVVRKIFSSLLEQGYDIIHISFSSALSGSYNNSVVVSRDLADEYKERRIVVVDSLCASLGEGLLVYKAIQMKEIGFNFEEVYQWVETNKMNICHQFTVDDLFHLHRGGRVSKAAAIIGSMINVKPILHVDIEGRLIPLLNVRGRKKSLTTLVENMQKRIEGYEEEKDVFISYGDCLEDAEFVKNLIVDRYPNKNVVISHISPTVGSHSGPGTVALFFMGNER
ncbi:DegV family protein [Anaeromicropila herbilytica]|uniref:DegV family protein n=1 Tax=Anaeromicropila herbilytica TaxID=2785025 RepID=A0A7R7IFD9_9FIRM|nr:DegV family protein [Anaeromicropila herbilytica]BCN32991.1 hypothetical protein bsdtb5_42860 [Anaeromicropila herbilytica]